jgi:outer membrane immunogenic protein
MKKILVSAVAASALLCSGASWAADMPMAMKAAPIVAAGYDWTGLYFGGHIGGGWQEERFTDPSGFVALNSLFFTPAFTSGPADQRVNKNSFLGGVQAGANYQIGRLVLGTEFDFSWTSLKSTAGGALVLNPAAVGSVGTEAFTSDTNWVATATTRLGIARDTWLLYGKSGAAWSRSNNTVALTATPAPGFAPATLAGSLSDNRVGWTVGTGVEWAFAKNWTAKVEYDYIDFGTKVKNIATTGTTGALLGAPVPFAANIPVSVRQDLSLVKVGINYKLDPGTLFW